MVAVRLQLVGAKDDGGGGDSWNYKRCKAPVKLSPSTNQQPVSHSMDLLTSSSSGIFRPLLGPLRLSVTFGGGLPSLF